MGIKTIKKYITRVFVFKACLFHSEGVLMFVFVSVNTCRNPEGVTQGITQGS